MALSVHDCAAFAVELLEVCHVEARRGELNGDGIGAVRWRLRFYALRQLCRVASSFYAIALPPHLETFPE